MRRNTALLQIYETARFAGDMNKTRTYKISELSAVAGVPQATLRLWEQHGLLHPVRTASGYRLFGEGDFSRVKEIVRLRSVLGLNLAAIRSALAENGSKSAHDPGKKNAKDERAPSLGPAIRRLRKERSMTIEQLAATAAVSPSIISTLERTSRGASVRLLKTLAEILGTTITELAMRTPSRSKSVVRAGKGRALPMLGSGIKIVELASGPRMMDCQEWTLQPGSESEGFYAHEGEEFIRVLAGVFDIEVEGLGRVKMRAGDSIYFESHKPHSWRCAGDEICRLIWVNTPPTF